VPTFALDFNHHLQNPERCRPLPPPPPPPPLLLLLLPA
jgi:hypothetical protein